MTVSAKFTVLVALAASRCSAQAPSYDCDADYADWKASWSYDKQAWCCENRGSACSTADGPAFDCGAALENWQKAWSDKKKAHCCEVTDGAAGCESRSIISSSIWMGASSVDVATVRDILLVVVLLIVIGVLVFLIYKEHKKDHGGLGA